MDISNNEQSIKTPSQDVQVRSWELLTPTQMLVDEKSQPQQQQQEIVKKKNKFHGNRKLYHFKRKCRARGLNDEQIITLIQQRNHTIPEPSLNDQIIHEQNQQANKRKRDQLQKDLTNGSIKSLSQLSIVQEATTKKMKNTTEGATSTDNESNPFDEIEFNLHKFSKYLKMPRRLLINSLHLQLNYPLKKKKEQYFILSRLRLLDEQFCFDQIRYLYQTYFDCGSNSHIWPNDILKITQVNEHSLIEKYIEGYLIQLRNKIQRYTTDLIEQSASCPLTFLSSLEIIDLRLKEFIRLHHIDLSRTINYQVNKFKDIIYESYLFQELSSFDLSLEQHEAINQLTAIRKKQLNIFKEMTMFEQRILCHRLPKSFDYIKVENDDQQCTIKRNKIIQDLKRQMLNVKLQQYEIKFQEYEHIYQHELTIFEVEHLKTKSSDLNDQMEDISINLLLKTYLNQQTNRLIRQIRYKESCFHTKLLRRRHSHSSSSSIKKTINVYPQVIVDVSKPISLNHNQLDYLSRNGPNYIRPNQSYLHKHERRQKHIKKEHDNIMKVVTAYLVRVYHMPNTATIIKQFSQQLQLYLHQRYMAPLSYLNIYRIRNELNLVKSIRYRLKKEKYILRVTDKSGIFHIGHAKDYEKKAEAHRQRTGAYIELATNPLMTVYDKVVHLLNDLRSKKHIRAWQLNKMMPKREKVELAYLYFVPKPHKEGTPLRPIQSSMKTPTTEISKLLDTLIRPIFDKNVRSTTIIDGVDLIRRLQTYAYRGYLKPTTLFCTFDITDLYTMLPQEESLNILMEFLTYYGYQKVRGIPLDAIRKLARIVITENVFIYEKKFYKQIVGGAMGLAFTLTLANIFMWKWEQRLILQQKASNEIYARYIDDIFLTSNESLETLNAMLNEANNLHSNIKLTRQIGTSLPFLDVFIENENGILTTSVYHKEAAEPYVLPFKSDHPRHIFGNIIETALLRAIRYSTTSDVFNIEQRYIKLMLLYNGYPPRYICTRFKEFFRRYTSSSSSSSIQPFFKNEYEFNNIRLKLLDQQTSAEKQIQFRIDKAQNYNKSPGAKHTKHEQQQLSKKDKWNRCVIVHYTHEERLANNKKDFHQIWNNIFSTIPTVNTKLIIGTRNRRNATKEMVSKRPRTQPIRKKTKQKTN